MFTRAMFATPDMNAQHLLLTDLTRLIQQAQIKTTLNQTLGKINAANLRQAHQLLESGSAIGKVVLAGW